MFTQFMCSTQFRKCLFMSGLEAVRWEQYFTDEVRADIGEDMTPDPSLSPLAEQGRIFCSFLPVICILRNPWLPENVV